METSIEATVKPAASTATAVPDEKGETSQKTQPVVTSMPSTPEEVVQERSTRLPRAPKGHNQALLDDMDEFLAGKEAYDLENEVRGDDIDVSLKSAKKPTEKSARKEKPKDEMPRDEKPKDEKPKDEKKAKEPAKSMVGKVGEEKGKKDGLRSVEEDRRMKEANSTDGRKISAPTKAKSKKSHDGKKKTTKSSDTRKKPKKFPRKTKSAEKQRTPRKNSKTAPGLMSQLGKLTTRKSKESVKPHNTKPHQSKE